MLDTICNTQYSHYKKCTALKRRRVGSWDIVGQSHKLSPPPPPPVVLPLQARCSPKKQVDVVISVKDTLKLLYLVRSDITQPPSTISPHTRLLLSYSKCFQKYLTYYCIAQVRLPPTQVPCLASYEAVVHLLTLPYWQRSPESPCSPPNWSSIK